MSRFTRKALRAVLLVALVIAALPIALVAETSPANAQAEGAAQWFPGDTGVFFEANTSDLGGAIDTLSALMTGAGIPLTRELVLSSINRPLSALLSRQADFTKDVLGWLGDRVSIGVRYAPNSVSRTGLYNPREIVALLAVRDDNAARAFVDEINQSLRNVFEINTTPVGSAEATIFTPRLPDAPRIAIWPGYLLLAANVDSLAWFLDGYANGPHLDTNTAYTRVLKALPPGAQITLYLEGQLVAAMSGALTTGTSAQSKLLTYMRESNQALLGQIYALRRDKNVFSFEVAQSVNPTRANAALRKLGIATYAGKSHSVLIPSRIPADAVATIIGNDIPGLWAYSAASIPRLVGVLSQEIYRDSRSIENVLIATAAFGTFESAFRTFFDLDFQRDVLNWMGGEFALYLVYNPDGDLAQNAQVALPFDATLILDATNAAGARKFFTQVAQGLPSISAGLSPISAGTGLYQVRIPRTQIPAVFGLTGNTALLTTRSGLEKSLTAASGRGQTLASTSGWQSFFPESVTTNQFVLHLNLQLLNLAFRDQFDRNKVSIGQDEDAILKLMATFDSATIYGFSNQQGDSLSVMALALPPS